MKLSKFYNTINDPNKSELDIQANTQAEKIYKFFKNNPFKEFTPFDVQRRMRIQLIINSPITSIRRAITDLTEVGLLEKTGNKKPGIYGKNNYTWRLKQ